MIRLTHFSWKQMFFFIPLLVNRRSHPPLQKFYCESKLADYNKSCKKFQGLLLLWLQNELKNVEHLRFSKAKFLTPKFCKCIFSGDKNTSFKTPRLSNIWVCHYSFLSIIHHPGHYFQQSCSQYFMFWRRIDKVYQINITNHKLKHSFLLIRANPPILLLERKQTSSQASKLC